MSYLARIELNAEQIAELGIWDSYLWHKRLWEFFPSSPEQSRDFLSRIDQYDGGARAWLLSTRRPVRPSWCPPDGFTVKEVAASFLGHRRYAFDLRGNPIKSLPQRDASGSRRPSKRVPLIKPEELRSWLDRKARDGGFRIDDSKALEIGPVVKSHFRKDGRGGCHGGVVFRGVLEVTDPARFAETYKKGIGSAKSFGFGLLLIAPVRA